MHYRGLFGTAAKKKQMSLGGRGRGVLQFCFLGKKKCFILCLSATNIKKLKLLENDSKNFFFLLKKEIKAPYVRKFSSFRQKYTTSSLKIKINIIKKNLYC